MNVQRNSKIWFFKLHQYSRKGFLKFRLNHHWIKPAGFETDIKIYNKIKNEKVPLILLNKNFVKWYLCGPTVYNSSHVGHASTYVRFDIIRRILEQNFGIRPVVALGITDIDDKIIKKANLLSTNFKTLAKKYELEFFKNLKDLNVLSPTFVLRVSDHIPHIIDFIYKIVDKRQAYVSKEGCVYFDTASFGKYGKLNPIPLENSDPVRIGKKSYLDFTLWKAAKPGEPFWDSPWGNGRPGWHIECSAMASEIFGSKMDLHSGGIDLKFPHHENEEAQSCSYHDCDQWVNYWLHSGQLMIDDEKMSKSLNNFITIDEFLKTYSSDHMRMFCFESHYRNALHYSSESMKTAVSTCNLFSDFLMDANSYIKSNWYKGNVEESIILKMSNVIKDCLMDDFNTSQCLISLMNLTKNTVRMMNEEVTVTSSRSPGAVAAVKTYVEGLLKSFGFQLDTALSQEGEDDIKMEFILNSAINFRQEVRKEALALKDKTLKGNLLKSCDSFRENLGTVGITLKDQEKNATSWGIKTKKELKH
ncbi:Cysteinyl-tRNA synthetase, putative [Pediculus humanus corporis]|uniref:cysteine--tRNA ligase n=1 Tax=Pediculus humanus subsp. corporis TaxID=121224 RepID=E0W311_PEDHC|nr:Cysteinyl-tRNA synthetase, putative [Pediculus humanus corporis]EEB20017.1 Cysteinyl-tRNA synthetase, putative [Pediculus humanus corporis]